MFKEIKSNFIKEKIKTTKWKDRDYIDSLMSIEKLALGTYVSSGTGYIRGILCEKYPEEWTAIWIELNPKGYKAEQKRLKEESEKEKRDQMTFAQVEKARKKQEKDEWKKLGGKS